MLVKKIYEIQPHLEGFNVESHTNFIIEFFQNMKREIVQHLGNIYHGVRPHAHDIVSSIAAKMYRFSSWSAQEFLRFYNFIQGRKDLRVNQNTSSFLADMVKHKEESRISVSKKPAYEANHVDVLGRNTGEA